MTAVHPRGVRPLRMLLVPLLVPAMAAARPKPSADVPPVPGPVIRSLDAMPAPGRKAITARAVIATDGLDGPAAVSLAVGASTAWVKVEPGQGDVTVEREIPLTRAKPWTPGRPVRFLLIAGVTRKGASIDRRGIRFALRTLDLRDGRLYLNEAPFQVRAIEHPAGSPVSVPVGKALRAAGYNAILLPPDLRTAEAHDACDAAGLLALDEVPGPGPALLKLRPAADPAPDDRALAVFGSATGFTEALRFTLAERLEAGLAGIRRDPAHPGFLISAAPPPDLGGRFADRSLAIDPPPALAPTAMDFSATVTLGPGPWPADAVLEWRRGESGDDAGWTPFPRRRLEPRATRILPLPAVERPGRWSVEVRARAGRRTLAAATGRWRTAEFADPSQFSFALAGESPEIRAAYGAWIIPAEHATVIVAVRPAALPSADVSGLLRWLVRGKTVIFLGLDGRDAQALTAHPEGCWTLEPVAMDPASHATWVRDRLGARLPAIGRSESGSWFAGVPYEPLLPTLSLQPLPGATVWAGESPLDQGHPPLASVMTVTAGAGKAVFCQWKILEALPSPLARRVFERLLGL